jgi:hypothetical protein
MFAGRSARIKLVGSKLMTTRNKQSQQSGGSGGPPFHILAPSNLPGGKEFVALRPDGKYDITIEVGLNNPRDNNQYKAVRFVNGKLIPGSVQIDSRTKQFTFEAIEPDKKTGTVELVLCSVNKIDTDQGTKPLIISKDKFKPVSPKSEQEKLKSIVVSTSYPGPTGIHSILVQLFDDKGKGSVGDVEVIASQSFEFNGAVYDGYHKFNIGNINGISVRIKPLMHTEEFQFINTHTMEIAKGILLKRK